MTGSGSPESPSTLALKFRLHELVLRYWREVDTNWGEAAPDFFTVDGTFESENMALRGRDEIRAFYAWRRDRGERVARHIVDNLLVALDGEDRATVSYMMTIYAGDGKPVLPVSSPNLVCDVTESFVRRDGEWLVSRKAFRTLFKGDVPATVMPAEALAATRNDAAIR